MVTKKSKKGMADKRVAELVIEYIHETMLDHDCEKEVIKQEDIMIDHVLTTDLGFGSSLRNDLLDLLDDRLSTKFNEAEIGVDCADPDLIGMMVMDVIMLVWWRLEN